MVDVSKAQKKKPPKKKKKKKLSTAYMRVGISNSDGENFLDVHIVGTVKDSGQMEYDDNSPFANSFSRQSGEYFSMKSVMTFMLPHVLWKGKALKGEAVVELEKASDRGKLYAQVPPSSEKKFIGMVTWEIEEKRK